MTKITPKQLAHERINNICLPNGLYTILDLTNLNLATLPNEIQKAAHIKVLYLNNNQLTDLPEAIGALNNLRDLEIRNNLLENLPTGITNLTNLTNLDLRNNNFTIFPQEITELINLKVLDLRKNQIETLPIEMLKLQNLRRLDLRGNPIRIPPEILEKTNEPQKILSYYFSVSQPKRVIDIVMEGLSKFETQNISQNIFKELVDNTFLQSFGKSTAKPLNELKLLVVGQGSVGKTSIVQQILHNTFDQNQTKTEGISINQCTVADGSLTVEEESPSTVNGPSSIKLNIWDFGGQEIMHATHQFFLTKRSLYLLVLDSRLTQEENRVEYWLKIIQSFSDESPVLIVGNKIDQHPLDIDRTGLQKKYPNIVGILETSAATGAGIEELKAAITEQVNHLPHVRDLLPETWFTVKTKLEELGRQSNFITHDKYLDLCAENEVSDETSQRTLIGFLHDLGVVLHFQDDPRLEALGILNPQWVTNGVYKILNSHTLFQNKGVLTTSMLDEILNLPEYPRGKRLFIVDMMKKFELCYDIEPDKTFLVPDLLPKDEPYTGEWDGALAFQIHYNVLPSSIISRFIVRMNAFIHKTIWRSGVVLKREGNTALVKADIEDKKIYIWVNGNEITRRDFLYTIRTEFDAIHKTIAKIEATEKVPLPNNPEAAPIDLEFLQHLAIEGRESLPVQAGNQIIDLIVKEVLNRIEKEGGNVTKSGRDMQTVEITGNGNTVILGDAKKKSLSKRKPKN